MFRYVLFAHALGVPQDDCLVDDPTSQEGGFPDADCQDTEPKYHTPVTNTGIGDFPGSDILIALGAFDDANGLPIGTPFMQASTLMHELGHTLERRHGGDIMNPPCSSGYFSVMNYLYQLRGLLDDSGKPNLNYSGQDLGEINEAALSDPLLVDWPYRAGWYAPNAIGGTPATRHCDGTPLLENPDGTPAELPMFRVDSPQLNAPLDWNGDLNTATTFQDINFDGVVDPDKPLKGPDDWASIRLNQVGGRRSVGGWFFASDGLYMGPMSLDAGRGDFGRGDFGRGDFGRGDFGRGDFGRGDFGRGDFGRGDFGRGDFGRGDFGRGDFGRGDFGTGDLAGIPRDQEGAIQAASLDFTTAESAGFGPPNELTAAVVLTGAPCFGLPLNLCASHGVQLDWTPPNAGSVIEYGAFRVGIPLSFEVETVAMSEFPKWRKYLISLSFRGQSSVRPVQVGGFDVNIVIHRSTAVRGRGGPPDMTHGPPPWEPSWPTRTGPVEADGAVDAQNAPTAPWKTRSVFHELPQGFSHQITHAKPRKAPK